MAQTVYKFYKMAFRPEWFALSPEQQHELTGKVQASLKAVGAEVILMAGSSDEKWHTLGVEKYPSFEAVAQHGMTMYMIKWSNYVEAESTLGVDLPPEMLG